MSDSSMDRNSIEVLAEEFVARYRNGERPPLSEYTLRYPQLANEIIDLFPAMLLMENLKPADHSQESPQHQDTPRTAAPPFAQLGDYRIIREVGRGGMGVVYEAEQVTLGRRVALKLLPKEMNSNSKHRLRFEREARAAAKLHHTNIVPVFGVGFEEQQCYYVMQFIQGQALDKILEELHRMNARPGAGTAAAKVQSVSQPTTQLQDAVQISADQPRSIDSRIAAGLVAQMLLTGVFHESDSESNGQPNDQAEDSCTATIVLAKSEELHRNLPQNENLWESKGGKEQTNRATASLGATAARQPGLSAKSTDSLKLSNSSITLSGRSGERPTKATREPTYWESVAKIGLQVAGALEYAHSQGVLHRDIKPANLVLDMKGTVWITDFGLARLQDERDLTRTGDILGTLRYMAPEVFKGQNDVRSELYALGLTLYELLALRPAFNGNSRNVLIDQVMTAEIEPLGRINPQIPSDLQTLIHKAISRDPQDRYQTAGELADDLQRFIDDEPIRARRVSTIERMKRWSRHNRGLSQALATVVALLLVINVAGPVLTLRMARLNSELKASEGRLSTTVVKLTSTAEELTKARNEAVLQAEQADAARQESLTMLADMQTERGLQAGHEGQLSTASLWFANAAALTPHDHDRQIANLRRAENWSIEAMTPVSLLKPGQDAQRIEFQPGGSLMMTLQQNGLRVWDWRNEVALPWSEQLPLAIDAAMSPDGTSIAALFNTGEVTLLDPSSGNALQNLQPAEGMISVNWSPDGQRLAVTGRRLQIWNVSSEPKLESDWSHPATITGVRFSRSGQQIVSCSEDNLARVFAINNANSPAPLYPPIDHRQGIKRRETAPIFCDSDRRIVTLSSSTHVPVLHDATTGTTLPIEWSIHGEMDRSLDVSPDGRWIAAGGSRDAILLSADGHRSILLPHSNHVHLAMFAPDNRSLATLGYEAIVRLFPLRDLNSSDAGMPEIMPQHGTFANGAFSPDSHALAVASNQQIVIWERKSAATVTGRISWNHAAVRPRPSFDGQFVTPGVFHEFYGAFLSNQTDLRVCRSNDGTQASPNIQIKGLLLDSCICADNTSVAAVSIEQEKGWVAVFDVVSGSPKWTPIALPATPVSVAARPGHPEIAVLHETGQLLIVNTTSGRFRQVHDHPGTEAPPDASTARVAYSPDGATIVSVLRNHQISIRDAQTGELRCPLLNPLIEWGVIRSIAFSPDSRLLATAVTGKNMAQVWSLSTGEKVGVGMSHPGDYFGLWSVRFSPDGKQLATSHKDGRVRIFDWQSGEVIGSPLQHSDEVNDIAYTPDGRHLLASVRNGRLHVWDVATGKLAVPLSVNHRPDGGGAVCLAGSHAIVLDSIGHSVLDLPTLIPPVEADVSSQLLRAELASNQKLQVGELVPLESHEWSTRWEQLVAARQSPEQVAESLARSLDAATDFQAQSLIIARAARRGLLEQLRILRPKSLPSLIALTLERSRTLQRSRRTVDRNPGLQNPGTTGESESATKSNRLAPHELAANEPAALDQLRAEVLARLQEISAHGSIDPGLMDAVSQLLIEDAPRGTWKSMEPATITGAEGTTFTPQPDGFILAGVGNAAPETYSIEGRAAVKRIAALKLDVTPHPSLPNGSTGHYFGNFHVTEVRARVRRADGTESSLTLRHATADHVRPLDRYTTSSDGPWGVLDGTSSRWDVYPVHQEPHWLMVIPDIPCELGENDTLIVELDTGDSTWPTARLGHFRLQVSEEPRAKLADELIIAVRQSELQPLEALVAACLINGESTTAMSLLQSAPQANNHNRLVRTLLHATTLLQLGDHDAAKQVVKDMLAEIVWEPLPRSLTGFVNSALREFGGLTQNDVENLATARVIERELTRLTNLIDASPDDHRRYQIRAEYLARLGRWSEAAQNYSQQLERTDDENWRMVMMRVATSHLFAGNYEAYRQTCEQAVERFPTANSIDEADVLTKTCLLVPETIELSRLPVQMVQEAAHPSDQQHPISWLTACSALAAYRTGQLEEARELSLQVTPGNWAAYYCLAQSVRAMAAERLGNHEEALQALANAELRIPEEISTLGENSQKISLPITALSIHHDWLIAELIRREAALLIHKDTARTPASDPTLPDSTGLRAREDLLTMGQWGECANLVSAELERSPRSRAMMTELAVLQLLASDSDSYRATCRKALNSFSGNLNSDQAEALCRICLLIPKAVDCNVLPVVQLRAAIDDPMASPHRDRWIATSALAAYRAGDLELALSETRKQTSTGDHQSSVTLLVKAMAEEMLGRRMDAENSLLEAETLIPSELRTLGTNNYTGLLPVPISTVDTDGLVAEILRREAAILIRGSDLDMAAVRELESAAPRDRFAMQGRWTEAAEAAKADFETGPRDRGLFCYTAALLMLSGNAEEHQRFCETGLQWFLPTTNPDVADSICKGCLLTPDWIDSAILPIDALRNGIADPNHQPGWGWYRSSLSLCLYRAGEYSQAIGEIDAIGQLQGHIGSLALVVRAMAEEKLGEHRKAMETLAEAETHIPAELSTLGTSEHTGRPFVAHSDISLDWLIPEVLRREAALLIRGDTMRLPDSARELERLGQQFFQQSSPERALIALRRATELDPASPTGNMWLGLTLNRLGFFEEAVSVLTRAIELGDESALASQALAEAERNQEILMRLPDLIEDRQKPKDVAEQQAIAEVCYYRSQFTQSVRFFVAAIEAGEELSPGESQLLYYNAACAATRASKGDGDGEQLSDQERLNFRQKAIDLLHGALEQTKKQLAEVQPAERSAVLANLRTWLIDRDLESLRDAEALWKKHAALLE